jgi:hypothetical protein
MNIRLIGLGDVGQEVVVAVSQYFHAKQIVSLLETKKVVKFTTRQCSDTLNNLRGATNNAEAAAHGVSCSSPEALRSLRRALAYLFFGGPDDELEKRGHELLDADGPDLEVSAAGRPHVEFLQGLYVNLAKVPGLRNTFRTHLSAGIFAHQAFLRAQEPMLGKDWLITPDLPVEEADLKSRFSSIGREMMKRILRSRDNKRERLTKGLGLVSAEVPVDVVAIAFSVGDSFGGSGAKELAHAIREILQELNHNRIVALIGLAVYERNVDVLDGCYVSDYLRINREGNGFDGLIARSRVPEAIQGFGPILATIAMASDPRVIQIDNPDANQLQRDFGKSLVSCGHGQPGHGAESNGQAPLLTLYQNAKADLFRHHAHPSSFELLKLFHDLVKEVRQGVPTWQPPRWVEKLLANPNQLGVIECETARKVVAYVGYDDAMQGNQINQLREALARDFPRARTVLYKYRVGDVMLWAGKPLPKAQAVTPAADESSKPGAAEPKARVSPLPEGRALPVAVAVAPARGNGQGGHGGDSPPMIAPPRRPVALAVPGPPARLAPSGLQPHVALFVVDSLETAALERFYDFLLNHVTVRHRDGRHLSWHGGDAQLIKTIVSRLLARSLVSVPGVGREWSPPFATSAKTRYLSCPKDTILGGVSEEFVRQLGAAVEEVVVGETIEASELQGEVAKVYETVNTEQMPLLRKSRQQRMEAKDVAEVLSGLNWLCNEELEKRKVACSLWEMINQDSSKATDEYY